MWWHRMVAPYVVKGAASPVFINQSLVGVIYRLFTHRTPGSGHYKMDMDVNIISLDPDVVRQLIKVIIVLLLGLLALLCRTKTTDRRDPRLLGEFALVVLTMLFVSERSWKHHYVTVLLPISYLVAEFFSPRLGQRGRAAIVLAWAASFSLMASTSPEFTSWLADGEGHEIAQGYGLFMWAGVILYATVAWRVWVRRGETSPDLRSGEPGREVSATSYEPPDSLSTGRPAMGRIPLGC